MLESLSPDNFSRIIIIFLFQEILPGFIQVEAVLNDLSLHPIVRHENSLALDPAQEVRETCELALSRIEELKNTSPSKSSPFLSVDPAAPASCSSVQELREVLLNEGNSMYERYAALFALRNLGGEEAISAIIESLGANSALLRPEVIPRLYFQLPLVLMDDSWQVDQMLLAALYFPFSSGHKNWVLCIAWSPDGKHLVSGSKAGELQCWDPQTGKPSGNPLIGHKKWITGISWEPVHLNAPCRRFVSASKDGDARIWDASLRKCVMCLTGHTLAITCVKWGGDGVIYTGSQDCTIKMWETSQGKLIRELKGHGHWVNSLALSTEYVLRTGAYDHTCKQYSSPEEMKKVALERYKKTKGNGPERLVSGSDDFTMFLWEPSVSKHPKTRMTGHQHLVNHVYFSPDGQWIASASFDKSVKLWNGITGKFVAAFRGHVGPVYQISWSADSRLLLSGSKDSTLKIWDIRTQKLKQDLPGHADEVFAVDWSPDGEKVASGGRDRVLKLWMG
ncbi:Notchless protein-like protein [Abeliophyllum distichum]|uniref:Notchless protein-like protein n=1 Tax=Abeliophyllum distichum TaxID=126358 RepID=A0ABD1NQQ8_9LAMI